jgi:hypothetical protein
MIKREQIIQLGYNSKTKGIKDDEDFKHNDFEERPYLINLNKGVIQIIKDIRLKNIGSLFNDIDEFENWHKKYVK